MEFHSKTSTVLGWMGIAFNSVTNFVELFLFDILCGKMCLGFMVLFL